MIGPCFVDTNVLIYSIDARFPEKKRIARELISRLSADKALVLSTQVLLEFFHASTRKLSYPDLKALAAVDAFCTEDVVHATPDLVKSALEISILEQQSVWDSMILAAALLRRCPIIYSEDLGDGRRIRGLEVRNPFKA